MSVTYRPFPNLYLFAAYGIQQAENQKPQLVQNYGGTWAPFPDGDLQFNFVYNQNISSVNNEKNTTMAPTISWKIAPKAMLNLSYSLLTSDSLVASTKSNYVSMILRLSF